MRFLPLFPRFRRSQGLPESIRSLPTPPRGVDSFTWLVVCTRPYSYRLTANLGILVAGLVALLRACCPGFAEGYRLGRTQIDPYPSSRYPPAWGEPDHPSRWGLEPSSSNSDRPALSPLSDLW